MSPPLPPTTPQTRPSWSYVLGLPGAERDSYLPFAEARALAARERRRFWLLAQALAAIAVAILRMGSLPWPMLLGWTTAVVGLAAVLAPGGRGVRRRTRRPDDDAISGLGFGIAWTIAIVLFGGPSADLPTFTLCVIDAVLLAFTGFLTAPAPLGGLVFVAVASVGGATAVLLDGAVALAGLVLLLGVASMASLAINARTLVDRIAAGQALGEKEEVVSLLLREFEDSGADWLWRTDTAKRLIDVTPRLALQFAAPRGQLEGRPLLALLAGEGWEQGRVGPGIRELADRLARRESFRDLVVPVAVTGETRWWSLSATPRRDERGSLIGFWGVGTDVTEQHRSAERIDRMARFDALTGLANRSHVIAALGDALRDGHATGRRSTLMLIDLDRFKQVNDTLGHPIGDRLLIDVAGRLSALAEGGDVCGRLGGDEFAVVVPDADDRDRVEALAETIVTSLSAPYEIDGHRLHIGASVGSATAPRDGRVVETMLRNADLALYQAKDEGRGIHRRYKPQLHAAAEQRRNIEVSLRAALERGELRLVYQPIVETADGRLTGFEALLRWTHPQLGPIAPAVFLPIAEEARLIGRIGDWVMHSACRDAAAWPGGVRLSVNLAASQLKDPQLPATIVAALSHSGLAAERLELEIVEAAFIHGGEPIGAVVDRLLSLGVRIALSEYATGQIDGYLREGRFSSIKVDRAFVQGVANQAPESIAIVRAIVALADSLGIVTIAEGAETHGDVDRMQRLGCGRVQGWMIGEPLDAAAALRLCGNAAPAAGVADDGDIDAARRSIA